MNEETEPTVGHNSGIAGERLKSFLERAERLQEEQKSLKGDEKEIWSELKSAGFDVKIAKKILKLKQMEPEKRREEQELLDLYASAIGMQESFL